MARSRPRKWWWWRRRSRRINDKHFTRVKNLHSFDGGIPYENREAANREVLLHRMSLEGYVRSGGRWFESEAMVAARIRKERIIDLVSPNSTAKTLVSDMVDDDQGKDEDEEDRDDDDDGSGGCPGQAVPRGRPPLNLKLPSTLILEAAAKAAAKKAEADEKMLKDATKAGYKRKNLHQARRSSTPFHTAEREEAKVNKNAAYEACSAYRVSQIEVLNDHLRNKTTSQLLIQSEVLAALSENGDVPLSEAQSSRLFDQALAVRFWFEKLEYSHPRLTAAQCADEVSAKLGFSVSGKTIYEWGRQYVSLGGFEADGQPATPRYNIHFNCYRRILTTFWCVPVHGVSRHRPTTVLRPRLSKIRH
jgi:hypothetical protein